MYTVGFVLIEKFNILYLYINRNKRILRDLNTYSAIIFHVCMYSRLIDDNEINQNLSSTGLWFHCCVKS